MTTVNVQATKSYAVLIGNGLLKTAAEEIQKVKNPCVAAIITDSNVGPIYLEGLKTSLEQTGFRVISFAFQAGEAQKTPETYLNILNFLAENHVTRTDLIIALGGGVVGDMAGFAAATYLRGIDYIQIPTSLLAMVDSSVGGKTAIDLPAGKNLVGAFCQPRLVLCDPDALNTLPEREFIGGCAEVIKYGVLYDAALFEHLRKHTTNFDRNYVVARCVELKRDVVAQDEFDTGARMQLNLGHTVGHAVERCSNFALSHGQAVAVGMSIIAKAAANAGICTAQTHETIVSVLRAFGLPVSTEFNSHQLFDGALADKKRTGLSINLILPERIGKCITKKYHIEQLEEFIESGLKLWI